jgi:hypothetical protein
MANGIAVVVERGNTLRPPADWFRELLAGNSQFGDVLGDVERLQLSQPEILERGEARRAVHRDGVRSAGKPGRGSFRFLYQPRRLRKGPSAIRPLPTTQAEFGTPLDILRADDGHTSLTDREESVVYQPMRPLADLEQDDGTFVRRQTVGISDPGRSPRHVTVALDRAARHIHSAPVDLDRATDHDCAADLSVWVESMADRRGPASITVRVIRGGIELWNPAVVRPRNSSATTVDVNILRSQHWSSMLGGSLCHWGDR